MNREDEALYELEYEMYKDLYQEDFKFLEHPKFKVELKPMNDKILKITIFKKETRFLFWTNRRPQRVDVYFYYPDKDFRTKQKWLKDAITNTNNMLKDMINAIYLPSAYSVIQSRDYTDLSYRL